MNAGMNAGMKMLPAGGRGASLEVQLHPADIRRRVRYLFLGRRRITALSLGLLVYLLFLALATGLAPLLLRDFAGGGEYQVLVGERMRQGQRMHELVGRLDQLADRGDDLGMQLARVRVVYGLQRGSPAVPAAVPPAALALPGSIYAGTVAQGRRLFARLQGGLGAASAALHELERFEREHGEEVATTPATCPLPAGSFVLTTPFARVRSPFTRELELHPGVDLAAPRGTPVRAPADGVVFLAGEHAAGAGWRRLGRLVVVAHGTRYATVFGHLDRIDVRRGERVRRGQLLGSVGTTGRSTHPHLHYEVRRLGASWGSGSASRLASRLASNTERPLDPRLFVLDQRWPGEERLLAEAAAAPQPGDFDPLPARIEIRRRRR